MMIAWHYVEIPQTLGFILIGILLFVGEKLHIKWKERK